MEILILGTLPEKIGDTVYMTYETLTKVCEKFADRVYSPIDTFEFQGDLFKRALEKVETADLIIGEQTHPSTGQGFELGYAYSHSTPFIIVAKKDSKISGSMKDNPNLRTVIQYSNFDSLKTSLNEYLSINF